MPVSRSLLRALAALVFAFPSAAVAQEDTASPFAGVWAAELEEKLDSGKTIRYPVALAIRDAGGGRFEAASRAEARLETAEGTVTLQVDTKYEGELKDGALVLTGRSKTARVMETGATQEAQPDNAVLRLEGGRLVGKSGNDEEGWVTFALDRQEMPVEPPAAGESATGGTVAAEEASRTAQPAVDGSGAEGAVAGVYAGLVRAKRFNRSSGGYDFYKRDDYYVFSTNGLFTKIVPQGGLIGFDFARAIDAQPGLGGRYEVSGGTLRLQWRESGETAELSLEQGGEGSLIIDGTNYRRAELAASGLRLEGAYVNSNYVDTSNPPARESGGVVSEHTIVFSSDGRFAARDFAGNWGRRAEDFGHTESSTSGASGAYEIRNGTLRLAFDDGIEERYTFFYLPDGRGDGPGRVVIDGVGFLRGE